jgi:hypothetical protein
MRLIVDSMESWDLRFKVWNFIKENPLFDQSHETPSLDEIRRISQARLVAFARKNFFNLEKGMESPELNWVYGTCSGTLDRALAKFGKFLFVNINNIG